jgi:hypothetical protein
MEAGSFSETLVTVFHNARCQNSEDGNKKRHCPENLKSEATFFSFRRAFQSQRDEMTWDID